MSSRLFLNGPLSTNVPVDASSVAKNTAKFAVLPHLADGCLIQEVRVSLGAADTGAAADNYGIRCSFGAFVFDGGHPPALTRDAFDSGVPLFRGFRSSGGSGAVSLCCPQAGAAMYAFPVSFLLGLRGGIVGFSCVNHDTDDAVLCVAGVVCCRVDSR